MRAGITEAMLLPISLIILKVPDLV